MEGQHQEPMLPDNNEEVIHMLGLDGEAYTTASKLTIDDIVRTLGINDLDCFTLTPGNLVPVSAIGFEGLQGQQLMGNALGTDQKTETFSYIDLSPVTPPAHNPHLSGGSVFITEANSQVASHQEVYSVFSDAITPPPSPQEVKSELKSEAYTPPASPQVVKSEAYTPPTSPRQVKYEFKPEPTTTWEDSEEDDARRPAGGKATTQKRRRGELKPKLYQRDEPLADPVAEKKRLNAINAKKNREAKKNRQQELEDQVKSLRGERDALEASNTKLRNKCEAFETQLKKVCQQFNVPLIILPE